jgi:hypothetical protein
MKKTIAVLLLLAAPLFAKAKQKIAIYTEEPGYQNTYIPSGFMGDWSDLKVNTKSQESPHSGSFCMKWEYSAKASKNQGWAGVFWQNPPNNWGIRDGGLNLSKVKKITFWVRGAKGGEIIEKFQVGGIEGQYHDSDMIFNGPFLLTTEWQQITVDLRDADLSYLIGGFCFVLTQRDNPEGAMFWLDDIVFQ